jgi:Bacterial mobilisation protein (MobC)
VNTSEVRQNIFQLRVGNTELDTLHVRAKSMDMSLSEYLRWRGLQPIGRLKKTNERKALEHSSFVAYLGFTKELNRQGINLNQLTRTMNAAKLAGQSVEGSVKQLAEIREILREIADSVKHLGEIS